jgi:hypothetical protein
VFETRKVERPEEIFKKGNKFSLARFVCVCGFSVSAELIFVMAFEKVGFSE